MLVTDDEALAKRAKHLTTQARLPGLEYSHDEVGFNYRLTNVAAAIGVAQLEQLDGFVRRKAEIAATYDAALGALPGITLPPRAPWARPSMWLYSILVDEARFGVGSRAIIGRLREAGVESRPLWQPLSRMAPFRTAQRLGAGVGTKLFERGLSLPCSVSLTEAEQELVIDVIRRAASS
jgi:dTDP-4-amino-4,6-dideoxygalactose transaminase